MSNYTIATNFGAKDALASGNAAKLILGAQFTTEFTNIATAIATKFDVGGTGLFADGTAALPGMAFTNNPSTGFSNAAGVLGLSTGGVQRLAVNTTGNVTLAAPTSGTALALPNTASIVAWSGANFIAGLGTQFVAGESELYTTLTNQFGLGTAGAASLIFYTNSLNRLNIASTGTVTINAPTSGNALTVGGAGWFADGTPASPGISFTNNTNTGIYNSAGTLGLATSGLVRVTIGTGGGVTIFQPSSGNALTIGGNIFLTGQSGANINITPAGAGAVNQSSFQYFTDNNLYIDAPATGTPTGGSIFFRGLASNNMATISGGNLSVANGTTAIVGPVYAGIPQNLQNISYTFVLGDANKHLYTQVSSLTWTIPANASVAYPIGTAITIINESATALTLAITTDTLAWIKGGSNAGGTRTIATESQVTILKVQATRWTLTGNGIS